MLPTQLPDLSASIPQGLSDLLIDHALDRSLRCFCCGAPIWHNRGQRDLCEICRAQGCSGLLVNCAQCNLYWSTTHTSFIAQRGNRPDGVPYWAWEWLRPDLGTAARRSIYWTATPWWWSSNDEDAYGLLLLSANAQVVHIHKPGPGRALSVEMRRYGLMSDAWRLYRRRQGELDRSGKGRTMPTFAVHPQAQKIMDVLKGLPILDRVDSLSWEMRRVTLGDDRWRQISLDYADALLDLPEVVQATAKVALLLQEWKRRPPESELEHTQWVRATRHLAHKLQVDAQQTPMPDFTGFIPPQEDPDEH